MINQQIADLRQEYNKGGLRRSDVGSDPIGLFRRWLSDASTAGQLEPNAMTLATVNARGEPEARVVLLKSLDDQGFVFFTNYQSAKGQQIAGNNCASLVFWWDKLERQVRVSGRVEKVAAAVSDEYFHSRPRASQLGAVASPQSQPVAGREELESRLAAAEKQYAGAEVARPANWGGYRLVPESIEFWVGRRSRLHDRILCSRSSVDASDVNSGWRLSRLGA